MQTKWDRKDVFMMLQISVICVGVASLLLEVGRRDQVLISIKEDVDSMNNITSDLLKSQIISATNDTKHTTMLEGLMRRVERLEK